MKKLLITSTDMMMIQFLIPHVRYLSENGFQVEIACSVVGQRLEDVKKALADVPCVIHTVRLERSPVKPKNLLGYRDMKRLLKENRYDLIWTNEPVMGVVTRLAARNARKQGTKVLYMCHGFHFYSGAPLLNWMVYYPVERLMSRFCDTIVTINREDEERAKAFHTAQVYRISGAGVDSSRFQAGSGVSRLEKRHQLQLKENDWVILSIGELTRRKNHEVVLRAMAKMNDPSVHYIICGKGNLQGYLERLVKDLALEQQVRFLGYRGDIPEICHMADCFAFPSLQEGLPFALMEAMSSGLPIVCSNIRGNVDLIDDGLGGVICNARSVEQFCEALTKLRTADSAPMAAYNREKMRIFDVEQAQKQVKTVFDDVLAL